MSLRGGTITTTAAPMHASVTALGSPVHTYSVATCAGRRLDITASTKSVKSIASMTTGFGPPEPKHPHEPFHAPVNPDVTKAGTINESRMMQKSESIAMATDRANRGMHSMTATSVNSANTITRIETSSQTTGVTLTHPLKNCTTLRTGGGSNLGLRSVSLTIAPPSSHSGITTRLTM